MNWSELDMAWMKGGYGQGSRDWAEPYSLMHACHHRPPWTHGVDGGLGIGSLLDGPGELIQRHHRVVGRRHHVVLLGWEHRGHEAVDLSERARGRGGG